MTKELLERHADTCEEIGELERQWKALPLREMLSFQEQHGERMAQVVASKMETEAFAGSLPWDKRKLVRAVMKHGPRWDLVRREIHSMKSPDALRMEYNRIFENNL